MTDNSQTPIDPLESGIIVKAVVTIVVSGLTIAGVVLTPDLTSQITSVVGSVTTAGFALWIIHNRMNKPCPPISSTKKGT